MKKQIVFAITILMLIGLVACNNRNEEPLEETEENGLEENEEEGSREEESEEETAGTDGDEESGSGEEPAEDENGTDEAEENEENSDNDNNNEEESTQPENLTKFYGLWRLESDQENDGDPLLLEIDLADAGNIENKTADFEYLRFGYESSEFFPMEEVVKIDRLGTADSYNITLSAIDDEDHTSRYSIELVDHITLVLVYLDTEEQKEMVFVKE